MREAEFRAWLEAQGYDAGTVSAQLARVARLERDYGDLDALHADGGLERLKRELTYTKDDERAGKPNPAAFTIDGDLYTGLASVRATINYYLNFIDAERGGSSRAAHAALIARLTTAEIEATMDDCDAAGIDDFLRQHGYVRPSNWVVRPVNEQRYPAKAIVGIAVGKLPGHAPLRASEYFGGFGESQSYARLRELGYAIVGKENSRAFLLFDADGAAFKPVRNGERDGRSVFKIKPTGASNRSEDAVRVETMAEVARAMLIDRLPARVQSVNGGQVNYVGYGKQKLVRYELDPAIANEIGVPPTGSVEFDLPSTNRGKEAPLMQSPTNLILYGPPGTGKTYATVAEAVRLCDRLAEGDALLTNPQRRGELKGRYDELVEARRVDFVTFHQSYSYEEFVEGLRPTQGNPEAEEEAAAGSAGFSLSSEEGVFRRIVRRAAASKGGGGHYEIGDRRIFKLSIGEAANPEDDYLFEEAITEGHALLGYGDIDWSDARFDERDAFIEACLAYDREHPDNDRPAPTPQTGRVQCPMIFRNWMKQGDLIIVSKGNSKFRAIGEVTGDYEYASRPTGVYPHRRKVKWLWIDKAGAPVDDIYARGFSMRSIYLMTRSELNFPALEGYINSQMADAGSAEPESYVLVIDEINRGNISKIFGELITLIEPDKRAGMENAIELRLPYSRDAFAVPANLHIIGTMNTADRSIALLDTALRRRFVFRELAPRASLLPVSVDGVPLQRALEVINDRIEYLIDREHRIGHAFFLGDGGRDRAAIDATMRDKVIPLLQEYFFEDWSRLAAALGERPGKGGAFLECRKLRDPTGSGGEDRESWSVLTSFAPDAYDRLIGKVSSAADAAAEESSE